MMNLNNIQGKDIIDLVIKLIGIFFPLLISYIIQYSRSDKNWRDKKSKTSFDKYAILQCMVFVFFFLFIFAIALFFLVVSCFTGHDVNDDISKKIFGISIIISIIIYFLYIRNRLYRVISIKKKYRRKIIKTIAYITYYFQCLIVGIVFFYSLFWKGDLIFVIGFLLISSCIIIEGIILDDVSIFKYKYISFTCKDGWKLDGILNQDVYKKGNWMIVKLNSAQEVRFKYDDITRIEYSNDIKTKII